MGAERQRVGFLVLRPAQHRDVRAERRGELYGHVAQSAEADHAHAAARAGAPGAQRRIGGDAGAEQRRGPREVEAVGYTQHEFLAHDDVLRVAAVVRCAGDPVLVGVGLGHAAAAELLLSLVALVAVLAGIDHAADRDGVADPVLPDVLADR